MLHLIAVLPVIFTTAGWALQNENDGVKVFTRVKEGSEVREVQAIGNISAPPTRVLKVLNDLENYKEFMPYTRESKIVKREGKAVYFYSYIAPPVVSNRDYTIKLWEDHTPDPVTPMYKVLWDSANEQGPGETDAVRVKINKGYWQLENSEDGKQTVATYYVYTDPAGSLPTWLVNKANKDSIPDVFRAIRKRISNKKYD